MEVPVDEVALAKVVVATVPAGENVFPVKVSVATKLFVFRSIILAAPEERLTTRKVRFDPVSEQNCETDPCGGVKICVLSSSSKSAV